MKDDKKQKTRRLHGRQSEERYWTTLMSVGDGVITTNAQGRVELLNPVAETLTGWTQDEACGRSLEEVFHLVSEETRQEIENPVRRVVREDQVVGLANYSVLISRDGKEYAITDSGAPIRDEQNRITGVVLVFRDQTAERAAQKALRESEAKYSTVVEAALDGIVIVQDGLIKFANEALEKMSGYSHQELIDKPLVDFIHPDDRGKAIQRIAERIEGRPISGALEVRHLSKDGTLKYLEAKGNIIQYNAKPADLIFIRDITERKKAEEAQRESEERFRSLYENSTLGLYRTTPDGRILLANPTLVKMLGYSSFDKLSTKDLEKNGFEPSYPRSRFLEMIEKEGEVRGLETAWLRKDWTTIFVRESARAIRDPQGKTLYYDGTVEDITERIQAEAALRESEEKYRSLVESVSDVIYAIDGGGTITYVSPVVKNAFGFEPDELIGRSFLELVYKEDQALLMTRFSELREGKVKYTDYRMIDKQGDIKWVRTLTNPVIENGVFVGARGALVDITERKNAEEKLAASLREKEVLLREIHHRVKNNMQIISSLLRLQSRSIEDDKMREVFNASQSRIRSMSLIHEKLYESKDFSRVDFSDYIGKMVTHLFVVYQMNAQDVSFKVEVKDIHLEITEAIPCGLIINELVSNALKYAFPKGEKGDMIIQMNRDESGKYHLSVKDTGIGLPPDFEIGKTETLGFQIVNDLVRQLNGTIELKREKGTEFRIVF
jgi:PAS domain S-box-containing protein